MLMCSCYLGAGGGHTDKGVLLLLSGHFGPLKATMHQAWHSHLKAPSLVRQNDVGEHLWWWHKLHHIGSHSHHLHQAVWVCFCFPPFAPHLSGLFGSFCLLDLLQHLMSQWPILPHDWHVVLGRAGGSARCMELSAVPAHMLVLGVWCLLLLLLWVRLRLPASFIDSSDSFGSEAHSMEVVCYGYVSPACFWASWLLWPWSQEWTISWPAHCLWGHRLDGIGCFVLFPHLLENCICWQGTSDNLPIHLESL